MKTNVTSKATDKKINDEIFFSSSTIFFPIVIVMTSEKCGGSERDCCLYEKLLFTRFQFHN
jgi:hypothetical protein